MIYQELQHSSQYTMKHKLKKEKENELRWDIHRHKSFN